MKTRNLEQKGRESTVEGMAVFLKLAHQNSRGAVSPFTNKLSKKRFTESQILACLLLREYLALGFRPLVGLLTSHAVLRTAIGLKEAPSHVTLVRFRQRLDPKLLEKFLNLIGAKLPKDVRNSLLQYRITQTQIPCMYYTAKSGENVWTLHRMKADGLQRRNIIAHENFLTNAPIVNIPGR